MTNSQKPSKRFISIVAIIFIIIVMWVLERLWDWLFG